MDPHLDKNDSGIDISSVVLATFIGLLLIIIIYVVFKDFYNVIKEKPKPVRQTECITT